MKKWKIISLATVSAGFIIAVNGYLIGKEDSPVERTVHVENWTRILEGDIIETFETNGVIIPQDEYYVFFDETEKEFTRFLVKEGDEVTAGTPLFEYTTPELDKLRETLEAEKKQAEGEIAGIEDYISDLASYQSSIPPAPSASERDAALEEDLNIDENVSSGMIISSIEQEIYKQQLEKIKLEEEIKKFDSQLSSINEHNGSAMMVSETDGVVKAVNEKLENPAVTIVSNTLAIEGKLTENQLKKTDPGMRMTADVAGEDKQLEGTLEKINPYPVKEPAINQESYYHYEANIVDQSETLAIGSQAAVSVVTEEAIGVPTVREKAIHNVQNPYVYQLNEEGLITKQSIQTGLGFDGVQEITEGAQSGQVVMISPDEVPKNGANFVTKMKVDNLKKSVIKEMSMREKWRSFLIGMIEK